MNAELNTRKTRLAVLISGRGSNLQALQTAIENGSLTNAEIVLVLSNRQNALGLSWAAAKNLPTCFIDAKSIQTISDQAITKEQRRELVDTQVVQALKNANVEAVVLAGYDRIISPVLLNAYPNRIVNIHPSLLPEFGGAGMVGLNVHQAVLEAGKTESGCTVHLVTEGVDEGPVLGQARVPVLADDTSESLATRVLAAEHTLYSQILSQWIAAGFAQKNDTQKALA